MNASTRGKSQKNDRPLPQPPSDSVSSMRISANGVMLAAASWDGSVTCYELQYQSGNAQLTGVVPHGSAAAEGPVLALDIAADNATIAFSGADCKVRLWSPASGTNQSQQIGQHQQPVRCLRYLPDRNLVCTGSWDRNVHFWDMRQATPAATFQVDERVYAMDARFPACVVGTASRNIFVYDLTAGREMKRHMSPMKYQTRCLSVFADNQGYAIGSVEGRVAIENFHSAPTHASRNFVFKCHRDRVAGSQHEHIYSVNDLCFHPLNTFATLGSDGVFAFWDKDVKHRLSIHERFKHACPLTTGCFSPNGAQFFYAVGYDWSKGAEQYNPQQMQPSIWVHNVTKAEISHRDQKKK